MQGIDKIILDNKGLVYKQLNKFNLVNDPDAESIAYEALYNAILNYDATKGTKLSTVATVYIYNALGSYTRTLNRKRQLEVISYNNIAYSDDNGDHEFCEMIQTETSIEAEYVHNELCRLAMKAFYEVYERLTNDKHKEIIRHWQESEFKAQTVEVAKLANVSQSYASQVINNFKHRLKKKLEDVYYD